MKSVVIASIAALGIGVVPAATATAATIVEQGPAIQYGATQFVIHSDRVGRNFLVKVTPPLLPVPAGHTLPVIYVLDGGYELAGPVGWELGGSGAMAPAVVVSVGYMPADFAHRDGDLSFRPYREGGRETPAGASAFEAFLVEELRPFVAARFPVDDAQAALFGHSLGGLFSAEILAERPMEFSGYIIASPAIHRDPSVLGRLAASAMRPHGQRVFLAVGGAEEPIMLQDYAQLAAAIAASGSKLTVVNRTYEGASHLSYYPRLVVDAFPWLLPALK